MLQQETAELFSEFISQRSTVFKLNEEDFLDEYKKIYSMLLSEDFSLE